MTRTIEFEVPGPPGFKARPRFSVKQLSSGKIVTHVFTDDRTHSFEQAVLMVYIGRARTSRMPHDGPVSIDVKATFGVPRSWPKWQRELALAGRFPHTVKPDFDNIVKAVTDALNGHAFTDDSHVCQALITKQYGSIPSTSVVLTFWDRPTRNKGA